MSPTTEPRATLQAIWDTRPGRRQSDRKIAGVAAAIARRYDIDPVLVRIAFVVAAFYGVGIALYLAAWVLLPADTHDPPTGPLVRRGGSVHPVVLIAAVIAGLAGTGSLLSGDPGVLVGLAVLGGLLYLLHQSRSERGLAIGAGPPDQGGAPGADSTSGPAVGMASGMAPATAVAGSTGVGAAPPAAPGEPKPPAWDPLGAAPFAWDLPEPGPGSAAPGPKPRPRRSALTLATIGLALLAGGVTAAFALAGSGVGGVRLIFGAMLAVIGVGLLIGAFRHAGRGLIAVAIPLVLLSYAAMANPMRHWQGAGELRAAPSTVAELAPSYRRTLGAVTLDLRNLNLVAPVEAATPGTRPSQSAVPAVPPAAPVPPVLPVPPVPSVPPVPAVAAPLAPVAVTPAGTGPVRTVVSLEAGEATVLLPANANVRVHCHADMGEVDCLGRSGRDEGPSADVEVFDPGVNVPSNSRPLDLEVTVRTGAVEVRRG
jgi:phage shock protein PspC (stress-responsive transcriptional regulator)